MKNSRLYFAVLIIPLLFLNAFSQEVVVFNDPNFKAYCVQNEEINLNGDDEIQVTEAEAFSGELQCTSCQLQDITGIENFINVRSVDFASNSLTEVDLSQNAALITLNLRNNNLINLSLTGNPLLTTAILNENELQTIDLSQNLQMGYLQLNDNFLTSIFLQNNTLLTDLYLGGSPIEEIDLIQNILLTYLVLEGTNITNIDLSQNTQLIHLWINGELESLDISYNVLLNYLDVATNINLFDVNFDNNNLLEYLNISTTQISNLDFNNYPLLNEFQAGSNQALIKLDLSNNPLLEYVVLRECFQLENVNMANGNNEFMGFSVEDSYNLQCVQIDEGFDPNDNSRWVIGGNEMYSTQCEAFMLTQDLDLVNAISLYPNPVKDILNIQSDLQVNEVRIYDVQAKLVKKGKFSSLDLSSIPTGVYIIQVETNKGIHTEKIIKK